MNGERRQRGDRRKACHACVGDRDIEEGSLAAEDAVSEEPAENGRTVTNKVPG